MDRFRPDASIGASCLDAKAFEQSAADNTGLTVSLVFIFAYNMLQFGGTLHQALVCKDVQARQQDFLKFERKFRKSITWEDTEKSLAYNYTLFKFLSVR